MCADPVLAARTRRLILSRRSFDHAVAAVIASGIADDHMDCEALEEIFVEAAAIPVNVTPKLAALRASPDAAAGPARLAEDDQVVLSVVPCVCVCA